MISSATASSFIIQAVVHAKEHLIKDNVNKYAALLHSPIFKTVNKHGA